ncbi:unnamed protein product, partial [Urochloa humidicola]
LSSPPSRCLFLPRPIRRKLPSPCKRRERTREGRKLEKEPREGKEKRGGRRERRSSVEKENAAGDDVN